MNVGKMKKGIPGATLIMTYDQDTHKILAIKVQPLLWNPEDKELLGVPIENPVYDIPEPTDYTWLERLAHSSSVSETMYILKEMEILA